MSKHDPCKCGHLREIHSFDLAADSPCAAPKCDCATFRVSETRHADPLYAVNRQVEIEQQQIHTERRDAREQRKEADARYEERMHQLSNRQAILDHIAKLLKEVRG
jgi:hypothetical protein